MHALILEEGISANLQASKWKIFTDYLDLTNVSLQRDTIL